MLVVLNSGLGQVLVQFVDQHIQLTARVTTFGGKEHDNLLSIQATKILINIQSNMQLITYLETFLGNTQTKTQTNS